MRKTKKLQGILNRTPWMAFYVISATGILLYLLLSLRYGSDLYTWLIQENSTSIRFSDYFFHYGATIDRHHLYENISWEAAGCFPPLAYCMYYALYLLTRPMDYIPKSWAKMEEIPGAMPVFTYYLIFTAFLLYIAISLTGKRNRKRDALIFVLLMMSAVFFGSAFPSGNSVVLVLSLLLLGLQLRASGKGWQRELGTLLLAVCVALKLYPAVFGLLYLKEKRYKELGRLILYSAVLLFGPFVFFGGITGLRYWVRNILTTMKYSDFYRLQYFQGIFYTLIRRLTGWEPGMLPMILSVLVSLFLTWNAWASRSKYRTLFFLITIMTFFPANAYRYSLCYFTIPLIMALKEERMEPEGMQSWPVMTLYGLLYTIPVWWLLVIPMEKRYAYYTLTSVEIYLYMIVYLLIGTVIVREYLIRKPWKGEKLKA